MTKLTTSSPLFLAYMKQRKDYPYSASTALHLARYNLKPRDRHAKALGVDLQPPRRNSRDLLAESSLILDDEKVTALGFTPKRLTARVSLFPSDYGESVEDMAHNAGFSLDKYDGDESRPDHASVRVDFDHGRSRYWLTLSEKESTYFYNGKGAARGVRRETMQEIRRRRAEDFGSYLEKYARGDYGPYYVKVEVLWGGEVIGSNGIGSEIQYDDNEVADLIAEHALIDEALDEAVKWADSAHDALPPRAKKCDVAAAE